jgi:hypothetical protein
MRLDSSLVFFLFFFMVVDFLNFFIFFLISKNREGSAHGRRNALAYEQ